MAKPKNFLEWLEQQPNPALHKKIDFAKGGNIPTEGITVYYIDLSRKCNAEMRRKTIAFNKWFWIHKLNPCQRINMKTWYARGNVGEKLEGYPFLLQKIHLLNMVFFAVPNGPAPALDEYSHKKYMARRNRMQARKAK